jgi:hypothetical protein
MLGAGELTGFAGAVADPQARFERRPSLKRVNDEEQVAFGRYRCSLRSGTSCI